MTKQLCLLALDHCLGSSLVLPLEMLTAASNIHRARQRGAHAFNIELLQCETEKQTVITASGLPLATDNTIFNVTKPDLLIIPSLWRNPKLGINRHRELIEWLKTVSESDSIICAVGTGSWFLAEADLLNNKAATTHWYYFDRFARDYPQVQLKQQHLITQAGNIYCAGSINSLADLMIHFIDKLFGKDIASRVEQQFSPESRQPYDQYAYTENASNPHHDEVIIQAQQWLNEQFAKSFSFEQLSTSLGLSTRTFNRRFKAATGVTPGQYVKRKRIHTARDLLQTSNLSISEIASSVGYGDTSQFCQLFKVDTGLTPNQYRRTVRAKLFSVVETSA